MMDPTLIDERFRAAAAECSLNVRHHRALRRIALLQGAPAPRESVLFIRSLGWLAAAQCALLAKLAWDGSEATQIFRAGWAMACRGDGSPADIVALDLIGIAVILCVFLSLAGAGSCSALLGDHGSLHGEEVDERLAAQMTLDMLEEREALRASAGGEGPPRSESPSKRL